MTLQFDDQQEAPKRTGRRPNSLGRPRFPAGAGARGQTVPRFGNQSKGSWEPVAKWYGKHLKEEDTFQSEVIFPGALRLLYPVKGKSYIDIACGEGSFARAVANTGASVLGFDISSTLIKQAEAKKIKGATFRVANATDFARYYDPKSFDGAACNLAIQNIDDFAAVFHDAGKVLKPGASFVIVLNHPMFRIPRQTGWGWDEKRGLQYRRTDAYLTPNEIPIVANPGEGAKSKVTYSYHRPLETYMKELAKAGFMVDAIEEWISHRNSDSGPRAKAENRSRQEIPMFMAIRAIKTKI
ncbi:MAG TPA: class I SAM-dependent methyltransferase [bacterium]|nr:class I SAM-dependent methyltransferase [bacterium]